MPIRILVVEDSNSTGSNLSEHLDNYLACVANDEDFPLAHGGKAGERAGHLSQLRPFKWSYDHNHFDVKLMPQQLLTPLTSAKGPAELKDEFEIAASKTFNSGSHLPDILIVDLALSDAETRLLKDEGGDEEPGPSNRDELADPRSTLEEMTGFCLLRAYSGSIPVIATSYARNPLVDQYCMMNGAFGMIRKPVVGDYRELGDKKHREWDMRTAQKMTKAELEEAALQNSNPLAVVVAQYQSAAAAEVLKAVLHLLIQRADGSLPEDLLRSYLGDPLD